MCWRCSSTGIYKILRINLCIQSKYSKYGAEKTPYSDTFYAVTIYIHLQKYILSKTFSKLDSLFITVYISIWFSLSSLKTVAVTRRFSVKAILQNIAKSLATLLIKKLRHSCPNVNFVKFLRTPFLQDTYKRLLLQRYFYV